MPTIRKTWPFPEISTAFGEVVKIITDYTAVRTALLALAVDLGAFRSARNKVNTPPGVANGTTAGRFQHTGNLAFEIDGICYSKSATDDVWNLSGLTTLTGAQYQATALCYDAAGTQSIVTGATAASAAAALALGLAGVGSTVAVIGVFVAGPSTNYGNALSSQGTLYQGRPLATATYAAPAAVTASVTLISP